MSPLAADPRDQQLPRMLAVSGALHVLMFLVGAAWLTLAPSHTRLSPVAVVDLISGSQFRPPAGEGASEPAAPAARRPEPARRSPPPAPKKERAPAAKAPSRPTLSARATAREVSTQDARAFSERIGRLRKEKEARAAVDAIQRETAVRAAVRHIGDRVAHRVDLSPLRQPGAGAGPAPRSAALAGGGAGNTRVSPELMAYARALDEKIRANWTVPDLALREAGKLIVQVVIIIEKDGRVSSLRMEKNSGNAYFDDSVLRAIRKASPLPIPPEQLRGGEDHYEVGFRFHGGGGQS